MELRGGQIVVVADAVDVEVQVVEQVLFVERSLELVLKRHGSVAPGL